MLRIEKIDEVGLGKNLGIRTAAVLLALTIAGVLLIFMGHNPLSVYASMLDGGLGSGYRFRETLVRTIPLALSSLGIAIAFRMKFWNIGGEGQIMMGAFAATYFGLFHASLPRPLLLPLMMTAGMLAGGIWAILPALFKLRLNTNETIMTLMFNYIALKWITFLQYVAWRDEEAFGYPKIPNLEESAQLPEIFGIHVGILAVPLLSALIYLAIRYTKKGYEIRVIGESESTARYAGINVPVVLLLTLFVSGALCGLVGMIQVAGVNSTLSVDVSNGVGYTAIIISWLAQLNAVAIVAAAFLFAVMVEGGSYIQTVYHIPAAAATLLQGLILFCVLGSAFFLRYRLRRAARSLAPAEGEAV